MIWPVHLRESGVELCKSVLFTLLQKHKCLYYTFAEIKIQKWSNKRTSGPFQIRKHVLSEGNKESKRRNLSVNCKHNEIYSDKRVSVNSFFMFTIKRAMRVINAKSAQEASSQHKDVF